MKRCIDCSSTWPVRSIAEYEPMQGVLIRYPFGISTLISAMSEDEIIYCLVLVIHRVQAIIQ